MIKDTDSHCKVGTDTTIKIKNWKGVAGTHRLSLRKRHEVVLFRLLHFGE